MKLFLALLLLAPHQAARERKIVLIAGPLDTHPKDTHEYERNVLLLKHLLGGSLPGARVEAHFDGWPADPATLDDADTIFLTSGGCDRKLEDHPFYVGERLAAIGKQMKRGCGLVQFHWSTFNPARHHDLITEWVGGYFDYETGPPPRKWFSKIETREWTTAVATPDHPVARGVRPFQVKEEFYYNLRFRESDPRLKPILLRQAGGDVRADTVGWAVERADGGRGFGFTGGHFYANWWIPEFRKLVLNAIAWTAKLDVPADGVASELGAPIRATVLTGHHYPAHEWRLTTAALLPVLEQDPRVRVTVSEEIEDLATAKIEAEDVLILNYMNWQRPGLSEAAKKGLLKFLERGGGFVLFHGALGTWNASLCPKDSDWPEFREKIAGRWWDSKSGHDNYGPFKVGIPSAAHPVTEGLAPFETADELYVHLAGDAPAEALVAARSKVTGKDEPLAWARSHGRARVFVTALGHGAESVRKAGALFRRGVVWAAGRERLRFDPPAERTEKFQFRPGSPWKPQAPAPPKEQGKLLPADPGLDGGKGGHWGLTGEKDWVDGRWNQTDVGPFITSALKIPDGTLTKAISIRVGEKGEGGVVFDPETLSLRAGWLGKFIAFSPARYGLIEMPKIAGEIRWTAPGGPKGRYRGLTLSGNRVVLAHDALLESPWLESAEGTTAFSRTFEGKGEVVLAGLEGARGARVERDGVSLAILERAGRVVAAAGGRLRIAEGPAIELAVDGRAKALVWSGAEDELPKFAALAKKSPPAEDLARLARSGAPRWGKALETRGHVSKEKGPYVVDTLTVPYENPWKALMFLSGVDFFASGDAAVSTIHGDVWTVSGIDERLEKLSWRRYATGLYQALGLRVVKDQVYVLGRDRITRLKDADGDGEADGYESFAADLPTSARGHDYITCLEIDREGNFYFASWKGLYRVSADGGRTELLATGFRNPNGLSVGPGGEITVAPQEGEWTPASMICEARPGGHYGYGGPMGGVDPPLCYLPRLMDNSTGAQVWVTGDRWGPLSGRLLNLSFGRCTMQLVLRDAADGRAQGAVAPFFKLSFASGIMRGAFRPQDGQLYVAGARGWVSAAVRDGCLQRVRYAGGKVPLPVAWRASRGGLSISFALPLDRAVAEDPDSYALERWNYRYSEKYGSEDYSVLRPDAVGHDAVDLKSARLSADGRSILLEIPGLAPVHQLRVRYALRDSDGEPVRGELVATVHRLGE
jgi:type 1 glutamine amidotransferase